MRVAILHYHYRPGGVTSVIQNILPALQSLGDIRARVINVPGTDYGESQNLCKDPYELAGRLEHAARERLGGTPDLWHIHNPTLGKHPAFPALIASLAGAGTPLLLHIHDFPEDGRPTNYHLIRQLPQSTSNLYPTAPHIHYGTINSRDSEILGAAGVPVENLHHLPNPIIPKDPENHPGKPEFALPSKQLHFYPVRATRRKNFGEFLLWATIAPKGHHFASSIGPTNPAQLQDYEHWQQLSKELNLPVSLGLCDDPAYPFPEIFHAASTCLTTSLAEGFGLAFLEPLLSKKPLWGRNLQEITGDFYAQGIEPGKLYDRLDIPLEWLDADKLKGHLKKKLLSTYKSYGRPLPQNATKTAWESFTKGNGCIDFGRLDSATQSEIIRKLHSSPGSHQEIRTPSPFLENPLPVPQQSGLILQNYSPEKCARQLYGIYKTLLQSGFSEPTFLDPAKILDQFLNPARFSFQLT